MKKTAQSETPLRLALAIGALMAFTPALAQEQARFSKRDTGAGREYAYVLRDERGEVETPVSFTLRRADLKDLDQGLRSRAQVEKDALPRIIARGNQRCAELAKRYNDRAFCKVTASGNAYQISRRRLSGVDADAVDRDVQSILAELTALHDRILEQNAFSIKRNGNSGTISIDYAAMTKRSVDPLTPVARAVKSMKMPIPGTTSSRRAALARAIAFMQAIPYVAQLER